MNSSKNSEASNNDMTCLPTSSSTHMPNSRVCSVCSEPSNGFYFGVLSCRACASFYRRSFFEKRRFLCRRFNNCDINADGMRNSCRACRLRRCLEAGMNIESSIFESKGSKSAMPNKNLDAETPATPSSVLNIDSLSKIYVNLSFDKTLPTITHFLKSLHDMEVGYKALSSVLGKWDPKLVESHSHVYHIKMQEYMKIRRGEAMLVLSLIREHFPEFDKLSGQTQIMILKNFAFRVLFMQRAEMTIKTFPDQTKECKQMIIHPGCVVDGRRMELFVGEETIQCFDDQKRLGMRERFL